MVTLFQAHRRGRLDFPMTALCPELPKFSWQGLKHSKTNVFWVVLDCLPCDKTLTFIYFSFNTGTSRLYKDGMMNYKTLNVFKIDRDRDQSEQGCILSGYLWPVKWTHKRYALWETAEEIWKKDKGWWLRAFKRTQGWVVIWKHTLSLRWQVLSLTWRIATGGEVHAI